MDIVYVAGDEFARHMGISMLSLMENNQQLPSLRVHVVDAGIEVTDKNRLIEVAKKYNRPLVFVDGNKIWQQHKPFYMLLKKYCGSAIPYLKLFLADILPELEVILYIDSDTVVVNSIEPLTAYSMDEYLVAAVAEPDKRTCDHHTERIIALNRRFYFNTGVMIVNLSKWRMQNMLRKVYDTILHKNDLISLADQSVYNLIVESDQVIKLPLKYNYWGHHILDVNSKMKNLLPEGLYSKEDLEQATRNPVIVHYLGLMNRPWFKGSIGNMAHYYLEYKKKSPWKHQPRISLCEAAGIPKSQPLKRLLFMCIVWRRKYFFWVKIRFTQVKWINRLFNNNPEKLFSAAEDHFNRASKE